MSWPALLAFERQMMPKSQSPDEKLAFSAMGKAVLLPFIEGSQDIAQHMTYILDILQTIVYDELACKKGWRF